MSLPRNTPLTIIDKDGNELKLFIDSNGQITQNGNIPFFESVTPIKLKLNYDDPNPNPNTDGYLLLENNTKQNKIQCENRTRVKRKGVRCKYIKGHGGAHIYWIGKSDYVNGEGKRTVKRGIHETPVSFENGWDEK